MECDSLCLDFALFDVDFVPAEDYRDIFADADQVTCKCLAISWYVSS